MSTITLPVLRHPLNPVMALCLLALVFGTLDILDAVFFWNFSMDVPAVDIFQGVASGLLGSVAFHGGLTTAILGGLLHYCIFFFMLAIYCLALMRFLALSQRPLSYGLAYGLVSYGVMRYAVLPLSAYHIVEGFYLGAFVNALLAQIVFVGLPCMLMSQGLYPAARVAIRTADESEIGHASPSH